MLITFDCVDSGGELNFLTVVAQLPLQPEQMLPHPLRALLNVR